MKLVQPLEPPCNITLDLHSDLLKIVESAVQVSSVINTLWFPILSLSARPLYAHSEFNRLRHSQEDCQILAGGGQANSCKDSVGSGVGRSLYLLSLLRGMKPAR